jgi:hypothetical protein
LLRFLVDVVKLGAHALTQFYDDENPKKSPATLQSSIQSYLLVENAKFSSSTNPQTKEENRTLVMDKIFPDLWDTLKTVEEYEAQRKEWEKKGIMPPHVPETISYHRFRRRSKSKSERKAGRQKKAARQQKAARSRATAQDKATGDQLYNDRVMQNIAEKEEQDPLLDVHGMEMQEASIRASSLSPTVASDGDYCDGVTLRHIAHDPIDSYERSFSKGSFASEAQMHSIPGLNNFDTLPGPSEASAQRSFGADLGHPPFFTSHNRAKYHPECPPSCPSENFSNFSFPQQTAELPSYSPQFMNHFHGFKYDEGGQPQPNKATPGPEIEPSQPHPGSSMAYTHPATLPQFGSSTCPQANSYGNTGQDSLPSAPAAGSFPSYNPIFQNTTFVPTAQQEYRTVQQTYEESSSMAPTKFLH